MQLKSQEQAAAMQACLLRCSIQSFAQSHQIESRSPRFLDPDDV